jgi:ArsR family transcriptional regulator
MAVQTLQRVFKTLNDPTRMRILFLLEREELAVQELVQILDTAQSTVSRHLGILREAGLLRDRRQGTSIYYRFLAPADAEWSDTWSLTRRSVADDATVGRDLANLELVLRQRESGTRRWFEEVGPDWDSIRRVFNDDVHRARAISRLIPSGLLVADIGTGTGILARDLVAAGVRVLAIDRSERMLQAATANLVDLPLGSVEFLRSEASALAVDSQSLDAAMAHMVLHYLASPAEAILEMVRVVKPGGRVIVVDFVHHEHEWMEAELGVIWQGFELESVRRWFSDAGLVDIRIEVDEERRRTGADLPQTFVAGALRPVQAG